VLNLKAKWVSEVNEFDHDRGNRGTQKMIAVSSVSKNTSSAFSLLTTCSVLKL